MSSDPCSDQWAGVYCSYPESVSVGEIAVDGYNLTGVFDAGSICMVNSLTILSLKQNQISGSIPEEIGQCKELTHLYLSGNKFSGSLPNSLSQLVNLKRLDISDNNFNGELPDLPRISGLVTYLEQNNHLSGKIPNFDFENFKKSEFNVANNNFSGPIPYLQGHLTADSFFGNSELCGEPLSTACPPSPAPLPPAEDSTQSYKGFFFFIYLGYIILGVFIVLLLALKFIPKNKPKKEKGDVEKNIIVDDKPSETSNVFRFGVNRSELSRTSFDSAVTPSTLLVLTSPLAKELQFEDLLKAPAELLGKGKHGSLYEVVLNSGVVLAVKRIKDWGISEEELRSRLQKTDQVGHPNILPLVAFYCSKQEKLLVYEYQQNGSLCQVLHELQNGHKFDWGSRLSVAASIAEALAYMHKELHEDKIAHVNLKSTNILF
ncbi:hypothetical protein CMV_026045 [Castanea mollissima]|uniref:Protein kinase domain-containing protein n=1 Tax=Castanea mollissima TaxID=60419 RepID=A0A8J4QBS2_9ROSI|nr:hypothetical protein CMV_026045 [Castanea mollissima]